MPKQTNVIATRTVAGEVLIFDYVKHPSKPSDGKCVPELRLTGHSREGYGLAWHPTKEGTIISASDDIRLWDIQGKTEDKTIIPAQIVFKSHTDLVEDIAWSPHHENTFVSVGDDRRIFVWDIRQPPNKPSNSIIDGHTGEVNCVAVNPFCEYIFATGGGDKCVALWDFRNLKGKLHTFQGHNGNFIIDLFLPPKSPTHQIKYTICLGLPSMKPFWVQPAAIVVFTFGI
jgi:histone-binding protein RBBP4